MKNNQNKEKVYPVKEHVEIIEKTLDSYGIKVRVAEVNYLPDDAIQYCLEITVGTKIEDIEKYKRELALALASSTGTIEIQAPIPGRSLIGLTVPKVMKVEDKRVNPDEPKTILGKVINKVAMVFGITAAILMFAVEEIEKNKNTGRQILIVTIVPVLITLFLYGNFDLTRIFELFLASFITWILVLGLQTNKNNKNVEKKDESTQDKETKGKFIANQHANKGE